MDFHSVASWQAAQKRLSEGETHMSRCTLKAAIVVGWVLVYFISYGLTG
jgi:hypothetical protein